ncbi:MAG: bifunctional proline dehydrogenase/L-glutamate gamma-semialdehyde dehydrogenase, partial [Chlamydiia bacterium]|nr:bifunctional proline dehydrogenase/L-glutamate gamma-semialdehyde dehydrogenase [Chlamydiia bacterium]
AQNIRVNINHLGEAILGEQEAQRRLNLYLHDLSEPAIEYISIKITTLYSQINYLAWEDTLEKLAIRLRQLYYTAMQNQFTQANGSTSSKFINLDMEEYKDLHLTIELFKKVLEEPEFLTYSAGIVLQAYLPDSYDALKELTEWSKKRMARGGAPIKVRIVKGANIAMEDVESSIMGWPRAPFHTKVETDANYKKMLDWACLPENAQAVHIGVASHNLFDIAYALILRAERGVQSFVTFEMLEGMCDHIRDVVHKLSGSMLVYCPTATVNDFQNAIAYLYRRLDENTGPDNFLRYSFGLRPSSDAWEIQSTMFTEACKEIGTISAAPRRTQNRFDPPTALDPGSTFENEPDTDFSLPHNRKWSEKIIATWQGKQLDPLPLVIGGSVIHHSPPEGKGYDKSNPSSPAYAYSLATAAEIDRALIVAKGHESYWGTVSVSERCRLITHLSQILRERRHDLIGAMILDGGKSILEADSEVSEAIDFAEYYTRSMQKMSFRYDLEWSPKGTYLVSSPWNFPIAIPAGGIIAGLVTGNCVLFKPSTSTALCGYQLAQCFWDAGIPKTVLQFLLLQNEPEGDQLIQDKRLTGVILTGATQTAQHFLSLRPDLDLCAETGGKNATIITAMADKDQAIADLVHSAFSHSGQKCSATSLAICEREIYFDPSFRKQLRDATASLPVGPAWNTTSRITPLIRPPNKALMRALTTLEPGEEWLLEPKQDSQNPNLWSPGIKLGVKKGSFTHQTELFGPVLSVMCANDLDHAIKLSNGTRFGLTAGIQSLDEREQHKWQKSIIAGNLYINRTTTGAIVRRQPFGGTKQSSFGFGSKAGGPNYLTQFMHIKQIGLPKETASVSDLINNLPPLITKFDLEKDDPGLWYVSLGNYAFWWQRIGRDKDSIKLIGQDNFFRYLPRKKVAIRLQPGDKAINYLRVFAAVLTCGVSLQISWDKQHVNFPIQANWDTLLPSCHLIEETEEQFITRIKNNDIRRLRLLSAPSEALQL